MMMIGSARIDEYGNVSGGAKGDQKQKKTPDYSGEVSMQQFYVHGKGWYIIRPVSPDHAEELARSMKRACDNPNIGYDQNNRLDVLTKNTMTPYKTSCDCSSLVRLCIREATGKDVGNFTTYNERTILKKSGLFMDPVLYTKGMTLYTGDILVTKTKGHTAIVTDGEPRERQTSRKKSISEIAKEVISGKWGSGEERKKRLAAAGYNHRLVQTEVTRLMKGN